MHSTRGNPAKLGFFSLVTIIVLPLASGSFLIDLTNGGVDREVLLKLRENAGLDAKLMQEANNRSLKRLFFDLESRDRSEARWALALYGRTPCESSPKTNDRNGDV